MAGGRPSAAQLRAMGFSAQVVAESLASLKMQEGGAEPKAGRASQGPNTKPKPRAKQSQRRTKAATSGPSGAGKKGKGNAGSGRGVTENHQPASKKKKDPPARSPDPKPQPPRSPTLDTLCRSPLPSSHPTFSGDGGERIDAPTPDLDFANVTLREPKGGKAALPTADPDLEGCPLFFDEPNPDAALTRQGPCQASLPPPDSPPLPIPRLKDGRRSSGATSACISAFKCLELGSPMVEDMMGAGPLRVLSDGESEEEGEGDPETNALIDQIRRASGGMSAPPSARAGCPPSPSPSDRRASGGGRSPFCSMGVDGASPMAPAQSEESGGAREQSSEQTVETFLKMIREDGERAEEEAMGSMGMNARPRRLLRKVSRRSPQSGGSARFSGRSSGRFSGSPMDLSPTCSMGDSPLPFGGGNASITEALPDFLAPRPTSEHQQGNLRPSPSYRLRRNTAGSGSPAPGLSPLSTLSSTLPLSPPPSSTPSGGMSEFGSPAPAFQACIPTIADEFTFGPSPKRQNTGGS